MKPYYYSPPFGNNKPLLKYCKRTHYTAKSYDWGNWNKVNGNYLRWETVFPKMQKVKELTGKKFITIADLTDKAFLSALGEFSLTILRNTDKQLIIDYGQLKPRKREFLFAGQNPDFWKAEKAINANTFKKKRRDYSQLYKQLAEQGGNTHYDNLERLLQEKCESLINL